jgi:hypothetical protein
VKRCSHEEDPAAAIKPHMRGPRRGRPAPAWVGRGVISAFIVVTLAALVITNLPSSHLRAKLMTPAEPYLNVLGLDQNWGIFAPDPRRQVLELEARLRYPDGSSETLRPPRGGALIGAYWDYRWQKLGENVMGGDGRELKRSLARWIARERRRRREPPASVTLLKLSYDLPPPGKGAARARPFTASPLLRLSLPPRKRAG